MTEHQKRMAGWAGLVLGYAAVFAMIIFWPETKGLIHQIAGWAIVGCVLALFYFKMHDRRKP